MPEKELRLPRMGETMDEGTIGAWLKQPGENPARRDFSRSRKRQDLCRNPGTRRWGNHKTFGFTGRNRGGRSANRGDLDAGYGIWSAVPETVNPGDNFYGG